ncbi:MAG: hypothetical protein ACJATF_003686 [Flavobacteriales bacterium]|jgi:hypothetical protein
MNTIKQLSFLFVLATGLFLSACSNSKLADDSLKNVPEDVTSVTAFNLNQMMQKADFDYVKGLDFFEAGIAEMEEKEPALAAIMSNPFSSGVDLSKNAYLIVDLDKNRPEEMQFGAMVFSINDSGAFQKTIEEIGEQTTIERTDYKMVSMEGDGGQKRGLIFWNDNFGMLAGGNRNIDIEAYAASYFDKTRETSIADNPDLAECLSNEYDIATWVSSNAISENPQLKTAASFMGISNSALKENYFHSYFNFEKGAITGNTKHFLQKELTNDLQLFFKNGVKKDLSKYIPAENLGMAFSAALDAKGIYQIISEKTGGATTLNAGLKKYGFSGKDIANAFGGDLVVAVYNNPKSKFDPNGLLTATIGDRKLFDQFLDLGVQFEVMVPEGENVYRLVDGPKELKDAYLYVSDDVFFISNAKSMLETIQSGGYASADRIPSDAYEALTDNAFGGLMNFEFMEGLEKFFENLPFTNARINAGLESSSMQMDLKNKEVNSLQAIFDMINKMYLKEKKEGKMEVEAEMI